MNHSGADQLITVVPRGKLSGRYPALRRIENDVSTLRCNVQRPVLQRLPIADPHTETRLFSLL